MKKEDNKRKKEKCYNLGDNEKEQLRKYKKEGKKVMRDNLDDEKKEHLKKEDNKRKKEKRDNLGDNEKEQLRKYEKEGKKVMRDSLGDDKKEQVRKNDKERKMDKEKMKEAVFLIMSKCVV